MDLDWCLAWTPVESSLKSRVWARRDYQGLRDPLKTAVKVPEIQVQGDFYTLGQPIASEEPTGIARDPVAMIHCMPMGNGHLFLQRWGIASSSWWSSGWSPPGARLARDPVDAWV